MKGNAQRFTWFSAGLVGLVTLAWALAVQGAKPDRRGIPLVTDWSHHHLIFSRPGTTEQLAQIESDPRYWQQMHRLSRHLALPTVPQASSALDRFELHAAGKFQKRRPIHRDWAETMGLGATVGAGNYPAKLSFGIDTANCDSDPQPDFVVFSTGLQSSGTQASIVAFDNLYSGCSGSVPLPYWAYDTTGSAPGTIKTSPVPSLDGSQIAFVQTDGVFHGTLVLLKWAANGRAFDAPGTPTLVHPASAYRGCTAPCMVMFDLRSGVNTQTDDTTSSVFIDYTGDIAWVGDSQGWLHKFTGVFLGTPAEVRTGGFPVQMPAAAALSSPVFDRITKTVFVGDQSGFLNRVDATSAAITQSGQIDFGTGIVGAPMVDVTLGQVYVSVSDDNSGGCTGGADCAGVFQFSANFVAGDLGTEAIVGTSTFAGTPTPNALYDGTVDNAYLTSPDGTGNLYVCGNTGANPTLYVIPIQSGILGNPAVLSTLATAGSNPACSPVTDISAPGAPGSSATERLFVSVQGNSTAAGCSGGGCIENFIDTPWQKSKSFTVGQEILVKSFSPLTRYINVVMTAGTSGTTQPVWPNTAGVTTTDGSVVWLNQGNPNIAVGTWVANHPFGLRARILDSGGNVELATVGGTSGGTQPLWATTPGATRTDGTVTWTNVGAFPSSGLAAAGGTSGIIIDNTVAPGTLSGASQVYFSTLADQPCATSGGTGGCAVQASQSALK